MPAILGSDSDAKSQGGTTWGALFDARQRRLAALSECDPEGARAGLALCRGLDAALRGDLDGVAGAVNDAAEALGLTSGGVV